MSNLSAELTVIETTVWWFQKLGKDFSKKTSSTEVLYGGFSLTKLNSVGSSGTGSE